MNTRCRMRTHASWILTAAVLGAASLQSPARGEDYWRNAPDNGSPQLYPTSQPVDIRSAGNRPRPVASQSGPDWRNHVSRVAQMEAQLQALQETRVAELEAEIAELNERLNASSEMLNAYGPMVGYPGGCCGSGCCEPCCPPVQTGWYAGYEFLFLRPYFDDSIGFLSAADGEVADRTHAVAHELDYDYDLASRLFVGYTNDCGLGFRTRYFHYDHDSDRPFYEIPMGGDAETPAIHPYLGSGEHFFMDNGAGNAFSAQSSLMLQTWDLEATNQLTFCRSLVTVGGGLRWLQIEQRYRATSIWNGVDILETLDNQHDFEGVGPTLAVELLRPFSCCSGLALYFNTRGSVLFGSSDQYFKKTDGATGEITETFVRNSADSTVYIAEVGLGLQYTRGIFYARGGWEGQYWADAGNPTTTNGDLALQGLSLTLGLNY